MDVHQPFNAGRFRFAVVEYAIRKIDQLRSKLIPARIMAPFGSVIYRQRQFDVFRVFVDLRDAQGAFGAHDLISSGICHPKAGRESGQPLLGKRQYRARHLVHFSKAALPTFCGKGDDLRRFKPAGSYWRVVPKIFSNRNQDRRNGTALVGVPTCQRLSRAISKA